MCRVLCPGMIEFTVSMREAPFKRKVTLNVDEIGGIEPHRTNDSMTVVLVRGSNWKHWVMAPYDDVADVVASASREYAS